MVQIKISEDVHYGKLDGTDSANGYILLIKMVIWQYEIVILPGECTRDTTVHKS